MWLFAFLGQAEHRGSVDEGRQKEEEGEGEFQRTEMWSAECVFSPLFTRFLTSPQKSPLQVTWRLLEPAKLHYWTDKSKLCMH